MSKIKTFVSGFAVLALALITSGVSNETAMASTGRKADIRITFDNESFADAYGGSTVNVPVAGGAGAYVDCYDDISANKKICNSTESGFGSDENGTYWSAVKEANYPNGGLLIDPNDPITNEYTIAIQFSTVMPEFKDWLRVISLSAVQEDGTLLQSDCGLYLEDKVVDGLAITHPNTYCVGGMANSTHAIDVSVENSEVVTLVSTRDAEGRVCMYDVADNGFVTKLSPCGSDGEDSLVNSGMIGLFMDNSDESPDNVKIYDIRIWDRPLNATQLNKVFAGGTAPSNVRAVPSGKKIKISWSAPSAPGVIDQYVAEVFETLEPLSKIKSCRSTGLSCKVTLPPGTYWLNVKARYPQGYGDVSPTLRIEIS